MELSIQGIAIHLQNRRSIKTIIHKTKLLKEDTECVICYQSITFKTPFIKLPCHDTHVFHIKCLQKWEIFSKYKTCPYCRTRY